MTRHVTLDELLRGARVVVGDDLAVRDLGLWEATLARPQTTVFGQAAYPAFHEKAVALLHSVVSNHALVDGNKRIAFAATRVFARLNGYTTEPGDEDAWFELVLAVAKGNLTEVSDIAERLRNLLTAS